LPADFHFQKSRKRFGGKPVQRTIYGKFLEYLLQERLLRSGMVKLGRRARINPGLLGDIIYGDAFPNKQQRNCIHLRLLENEVLVEIANFLWAKEKPASDIKETES